jgi:aromatic ring-cleaving dioxygenase
MYQALYDSSNQAEVESYLRDRSEGISILLHDDTGHHVKDHTDGARWIGTALDLDIDLLAKIDALGDH